jgi:hypothetical protein
LFIRKTGAITDTRGEKKRKKSPNTRFSRVLEDKEKRRPSPLNAWCNEINSPNKREEKRIVPSGFFHV